MPPCVKVTVTYGATIPALLQVVPKEADVRKNMAAAFKAWAARIHSARLPTPSLLDSSVVSSHHQYKKKTRVNLGSSLESCKVRVCEKTSPASRFPRRKSWTSKSETWVRVGTSSRRMPRRGRSFGPFVGPFIWSIGPFIGPLTHQTERYAAALIRLSHPAPPPPRKKKVTLI